MKANLKNSNPGNSINTTRRLTETAVMIALATALSYIIIFSLPMGGSITAFSQVPIIILGYRYGTRWGAFSGFIYGLLQMVLQGLGNFSYVKGLGSYIILILADYVFAFAFLGIGGSIFKRAKNQTFALTVGSLIACALRFLCHFFSGVTIWGEYADGWVSVWRYSAAYNGSYMAVETAITLVGVIMLSLVFDFSKPNLRKGAKRTRRNRESRER